MKFLIPLLFVIISCSPSKQFNVDNDYLLGTLNLNKNYLYIVCRGTNSKSPLIALKFNLIDSNITHVGIGFFKENTFNIYNVTDNNKNEESALVRDSYQSFKNSSDLYYLSIWQYKINKKRLGKIKQICEDYQKKKCLLTIISN